MVVELRVVPVVVERLYPVLYCLQCRCNVYRRYSCEDQYINSGEQIKSRYFVSRDLQKYIDIVKRSECPSGLRGRLARILTCYSRRPESVPLTCQLSGTMDGPAGSCGAVYPN